MRLHPDHILSFVELVRQGSIGGAAKARHLTQPAVSNQLRQLQDDIGENLYQRRGRGVVLTATGQAFYHHALAVEQALQAASAFSEGLQGLETGRVRVASSQTIAGSLLPAVLAAFQQRYPGIEMHVDTSNSRQVIGTLNDYDIGLVESPLPRQIPETHRAVPIGQDEVVLVMPDGHPLATRHSVPLALLADQPLIWREPGSGTSEVVAEAFRQAGAEVSRHLSLGGVAAVLEAVRQGLGLGFASHLTLKHTDGELITRPLTPRLLRPFTMLVPRHPSPAAQAFADFLAGHLPAPPA
jgi:LysR family transcriptional regulator, low CO2-responsive transcriptional regulator